MVSLSPHAQEALGRMFFLVVIMLFLSNPQNQTPPGLAQNTRIAPDGRSFESPRDVFKSGLTRTRRKIDVLNATHWGDWRWDEGRKSTMDADPKPLPMVQTGTNGTSIESNQTSIGGLNLTGFRNDDGFLWESIWPAVKERVKGMADRAGMSEGKAVYQNVTGQLLGEWVRSDIGLGGERGWTRPGNKSVDLSTIEPDVMWSGWGKWDKNVTSKGGNLGFVIREKDKKDRELEHIEEDRKGRRQKLRVIEATLTVDDETHGGEGWEMKLHGVHWPEEGTIVMTTTSSKFSGVYGLPHLTFTKDHFLGSQRLLNSTLSASLSKREAMSWGFPNDPFASDEDTSPHCEYIVYAQVHPITMADLYTTPVAKVEEDIPAELMALESELRYPEGAPVVKPLPVTMSLLAFSPDCGFVIESKGPPAYIPAEGKHLQGLKHEIYVMHVKHWCLIWGLLLMGQVALLRQQMKESSTPSTISRISLYTAGTLAGADFALVGALMLLATSAPLVFPAATLTAFAGCLSMGLGVRFLADVFNVQEPERREAQRVENMALAEEVIAFRARRDAFLANYAAEAAAIRSAAAARNTAPIITAAGVEAAQPPDAPAASPSTTPENETTSADAPAGPVSDPDPPIIIPSDQDVDAEIAENVAAVAPVPLTALPVTNQQIVQAIQQSRRGSDIASSTGMFMFFLMILFFLTMSSITWPPILRRIYFNVIGITYFSFWCPQIYRNVVRNCRKAFQWRFVAGQSILRLAPFAYFYLKEDNILFASRSLFSIGIIVAWVWIQILVLIGMEILGPRFALPKGWLPDAWDYHPLLRDDDVEGGGLPIGLMKVPGSPTLERVRTGEEGKRKKTDEQTRSVDCAICMQILEVPVLARGEESTSKAIGVSGLLARRAYMVTPCRHVFHSNCLEGWMKYRLQCPICRENLPAL